MDLFLIVFLPLAGALIVGLLGKRLGLLLSHIISCSFIAIPFMLSCYLFYFNFSSNNEISLYLFDWINSGSLSSSWTLYFDTLTSVMLVVVTSVSALVHIYSIGYMKNDPYQYRFFAYLSFFTFAMLMLVTSNNFLQLFFGWEGVGLASYLLIGFWYEKPSANSAAMKAFIVNRVGDFAFMLGIATLYFATGSVNFEEVFSLSNDLDDTIINLSCFLLFIGAMGKSAQLFLHTWLPDAMEGPTPVSALIHAATMVTAGVFLVARCSPLFEQSEIISSLIIFIGASTAFFAASVALVQNDIKRVIAYSTCSQLGYMFVALGVGAYQIAIFHLFTHAFFKALLFLGSGSVIHALSDEQDIRKMGGLAKLIPFTWLSMIIGTLALTGAPFLSGYYSKDGIIEAAYSSHSSGHLYAFYLLVFSVFLTSFYSWRLILLTFHGTTKTPNGVLKKVHESPLTMMAPLFILSLGSIFSGFLFADFFMSLDFQSLWTSSLYLGTNSEIIDSIHHSPLWVKTLPLVMMLAGLLLAMLMYVFFKSLPKNLSKRFSFFYDFLLNKWYFDEIYDLLFVKSARKIGNFLSVVFDKGIIDGLGPDGISLRVQQLAKYASRLQTGFIYHYALAMLVGLTAFIFLFVIFG